VVVRPDQYVTHVLPLGAHQELAAFFGGFLHVAELNFATRACARS